MSEFQSVQELIAVANKLVEDGNAYNALDLIYRCPAELRAELKDYYKHNASTFINHCIVAIDESQRGVNKLRRFVLHQAQKELVDEYQEFFNNRKPDEKRIEILKKSRRVGMTNTVLFVMLHRLLFWLDSSGIACLTRDKVDRKGDQSSLMERLRTAIQFLPFFLLPEKFNAVIDSPLQLLRVKDGAQGASISGHAIDDPKTADQFLKSGRYSMALIDEAAAMDSHCLNLALTACRASTDMTIVLSTAANSSSHAFEQMADKQGTYFEDKNIVRQRWFPHTINPDNTETWVNSFRTDEETYEREIKGNPFGSSNVVVSSPDFNIVKNIQTGANWSLEDTFIMRQMRNCEAVFMWDGGGTANYSACVIALKPKDTDRLICIKEFSSAPPREDFMPVAERAITWFKTNYPSVRIAHDIADPPLASEAPEFLATYGRKLNCLDTLRYPAANLNPATAKQFTNMYANRLTHRIARIRWYSKLRLTDGYPALIILPDCPALAKGITGGDWQFQTKHKAVTQDLLQNHPIVDICDALSLGILSLFPLARTGSGGTQRTVYKVF